MDTATHHDHDVHHTPVDRPNGPTFSASIVFALLLVGLLIASFNFVGIMSAEHHGEKGSVHHQQEATATQTLHGEDGLGADQPHPTQFSGSDSAKHENMAPAH